MKISILGAGNMGLAITQSILKSGTATDIVVANRSQSRLDNIPEDISRGLSLATTDFVEAVKNAKVVVLAVKPYAIEDTCRAIGNYLSSDSIVVSVAAGIPGSSIASWINNISEHIFSIIPNTAIKIGKGLTFVCPFSANEDSAKIVSDILRASGEVVFVGQKSLDAATALCSCGIAYVYKFIQAGIQAGIELGLKPADAANWFAATVAGAAEMIKATGKQPSELINEVTTPGGLTIRGVNALERNGFVGNVIEAITLPAKKA